MASTEACCKLKVPGTVLLPSICLSLVLALLFVADPAANAASREVVSAAGGCGFCHVTIMARYGSLPHGGGGPTGEANAGGAHPLACTACHTKSGLHALPVEGSQAGAVCGACHLKAGPRLGIQLSAEEWSASAHARNKVSCLSCHAVHHPMGPRLTRARADQGCLDCHARRPRSAHVTQAMSDGAKGNCLACHDPHGSQKGVLYDNRVGGEQWQLKKRFTHQPVAEGRCRDCHSVHKTPGGPEATQPTEPEDLAEFAGVTPGVGGPNTKLLTLPPAAICYDCHGEKHEQFVKSKHAMIGAKLNPPRQNACAACHLPHGSDYKHLTIYDGSRLCLGCHPEKTAHHFLASAAVKDKDVGCVACHDPHGTAFPSMLFGPRPKVCAACHKK